MANTTVYNALFTFGGRTTRYGEFTMVFLNGCSFVTTPMEFTQVGNWARGRISTGNPNRDRTTFVERFETILGRMGSGVANKGSKTSLLRIVKAMKANAVFMEGWNVPRDLEEGVEMKKKPVADPLAKAPGTHS